MSMKYNYETLDISGMTVSDAIIALQAWKDENPDAVEDYLVVNYDGEDSYVEVNFQRPMTETELEAQKAQQAQYAIYQEEADRAQYERLKAKFEGN
jgi:hypothetical protein